METYPNFSRNKTLYISQITFVIFMIVLILEKIVLSYSKGVLSIPPILDLFTLLGFFVFGTIVLGVYTYYSWKYDSIRFYMWMELHDFLSPKWMKEWRAEVSKEYILWSSRIVNPLAFFFGFIMSYGFTQVIKDLLFGS